MKHLETLEIVEIGGDGNSNPPPQSKKQSVQLLKFCFTFNNYTENDIIEIENTIKPICTKYLFQEETGESGTPHLQGAIWLKKKMRWESFGLSKSIHWEKMRNEEASIAYCGKDETRTGRQFIYGFPKPIKIITDLYPWQEECEKISLTEPNNQTINWYWESEGGVGKSEFVKYMVVKHKALPCLGGKFGDIMNMIFNANMDECRTIVFNLPRAHKGNISYSALECIKDGMIVNTKYETGYKVFNPPHLFIFANYPPDNEELISKRKWNIIEMKI